MVAASNFLYLLLLLILLWLTTDATTTSTSTSTVSTTSTTATSHNHHRNVGAPSSFDCLMRKAAYEYGKKLLPRQKEFLSLYYALDLGVTTSSSSSSSSDDCHLDLDLLEDREETAPTMTKTTTTTTTVKRRLGAATSNTKRAGDKLLLDSQLPDDAVFVVAPKNNNNNNGPDSSIMPDYKKLDIRNQERAGTTSHPLFYSIQNAIEYAVTNTTSKHVVLQQGVYYLTEPIQLTSRHSGVKITGGFPGDTGPPVLSGGIPLDVKEWKPYKIDGDSNIWVTNLAAPDTSNPHLNEMPGLQINGRERATRARYPNLPGGIEVSCGYGCMIPGGLAQWTPPRLDKYGNVTLYTDTNPHHTRGPNDGWFEHYMIGIHGLCSVYDPPVSYWCSEHPSGGGAFAFRTPSGLTPVNGSVLPNAKDYDPQRVQDDAIVFVWRPNRWANWMFTVDNYNATTSSSGGGNNMTFGAGGHQGARGHNSGGDWFIENLLEELDHPNEYYFDTRSQKLYLWYNGTEEGVPPPLDTDFVVPQLRTLLNVTGSTQWDPVKNVLVQGVTFRASRYTYMDPHGVPSGGDWALERKAAVFLQGTQHATIQSCTMERLDGNGLMISGYNRNTTIRGCDFSYIGGTAIASWGYTNETNTDPGRPGITLENAPFAGVDMTDGEHPRYNVIEGNTAREVGLYEKQSSFYMQAKTMYTTIRGNVFFNGPRAGINLNDGGGGGDEIYNNLVFSTCRESGDHGPFNSWDRQPFLTIKDNDPRPSMGAEWRKIHHNFFIDNYSPQENVDNDDGSAYFKTHDNFLVYGRKGQKNDFGGHDNHHFRNIYAYVDKAIGLSPQLEGHEDVFASNKVVTTGDDVGVTQCDGPGKTILHGNEYFTSTGNIQECGMNLSEWQLKGNDVNSTVALLPDDESIIGWARALLGF